MFTGLIEEVGKIQKIEENVEYSRLSVEAEKVLDDLAIGDSLSVNGTCLTVISSDAHTCTVDVMNETWSRTALGELKPGDPINLERAMRLGDRFGGHVVSGHIDGTGKISKCIPDDNAIRYHIEAAPELLRGIVEKGSIAIDGISLTVVSVSDTDFSVSIIPHTLEMTNLSAKDVGDAVNLELDIIGKYIEKLTLAQLTSEGD